MSSVASPPPALHAREPVRAHEGDDLVAHAGRRRPGHQEFDALGAIAGFLDQFALGRGHRRFAGVAGDVADESGRHLDGLGLDRLAPLLDEQDAVFRRHRDDDHAAARIGAFGEFPAAAFHQAQPASCVQRFRSATFKCQACSFPCSSRRRAEIGDNSVLGAFAPLRTIALAELHRRAAVLARSTSHFKQSSWIRA